MAGPQDKRLKVYEELCNSYRAIDDFRAKLLGFLPLATGTGVFLLVTDRTKIEFIQPLFLPIGIFGFAITLGLFFYELYGIKKCTHLISAGIELENELKIENGQFTRRPPGVAILINEPFAASVIYPAVLAAWTFLALAFQGQPQDSAPLTIRDTAQWWAIRVFLVGFAVSFLYNLFLIKDHIRNAIVRLKSWLKGFPKAGERIRELKYAVIVEEGPTSFGAHVPDLPGCVAVADTKAEVLDLIQEAIEFHIEGLREDGQPSPEPSSSVEYVEVRAA